MTMHRPLFADPADRPLIERPARAAAMVAGAMLGGAIAALVGLAGAEAIARAFDRPAACATLNAADCAAAVRP